MSRYHVRTLGRLSLHEESPDGEEVLRDAKALAVVAYLADTPGRSADRSHLAQLLWPGKEQGRARAALRQALYYLRRKTADGITLLRSGQDRVRLDENELSVDLWAFEEALSAERWDRVLELYGGPFLGGYDVEGADEFRHWRESCEDGIRAGVREACRALISRGLEEDDPDRAVRGARRWVDLNPLDEEARAALIRSLAAAGDRPGAFRAYESYRTLLREELGESPGPRLSETLEELRSLAEEPVSGEGAPGSELDAGSASPEWDPELVRSAGTAEDGRGGPGPSAQTGLGRGVAAAVLALAVLLLAAAGWRVFGPAGGSGEGVALSEEASPPVEVILQTGGTKAEPLHHRIRWTGDSVRVEPAPELSGPGVFAPDGGRRAVSVGTPEGTDLAVRGPAGSGEPRVLVATEADEAPVTWSPDGRRILYESGRLESDGRYVRRYRVHRLDEGPDIGLGLGITRSGSGRPDGDWSPLGTSVAVVSDSVGDPDIWMVSPDGTGPRNLTSGSDAPDLEPAFSPDGTRIAFVSERSGNPDVWVVEADGGRARRLTRSPWPDRGPVWLGPGRVGYFRTTGERRTWFRSVELASGEDRRLAEVPEGAGLAGARRTAADSSWIASVELPDRLSRAAPGQWIRRTVTVRDAGGAEIPARAVPLRWSVDDTSVVDPAAGDGWLRVRDTGAATIRVSAAGWRGDTVRLRSRRPGRRELAPVLTEDWSAGIDTARWTPAGEPVPAVVRPAGRFRAALTSRGDENYHSGVVARTPLRAAEGLTVEFWARAPLTEPQFQAFFVGLLPRVPPAARPTWGASRAVLEFGVSGGEPDSLAISLQERTWRVPAPDSLGAWRRYTVQVDTAGEVTVLVDGWTYWSAPGPLEMDLLEGSHLALYGRSRGTRILHGPVRVWEGVRHPMP